MSYNFNESLPKSKLSDNQIAEILSTCESMENSFRIKEFHDGDYLRMFWYETKTKSRASVRRRLLQRFQTTRNAREQRELL